jgi:thioredoxin 1
MADHVTTFTDGNWDAEVLKSKDVVLVDFWAEWCAPCRAMAPDLEAVALQYAGRVKVGKVNVEENGNVPAQYAISAMPTLLVLRGGRVLEQRVGRMSKDALVKLLEPHLA